MLIPAKPNRLARYGRVLVVIGAVEFCVSLAILLLASTNNISRFPVWFGLVDVALAITLVLTMLLNKAAVGGENDSRAIRNSYSILTYLVPLLIVGIWILRDQLLLNTLLPGLAWRMFVLFEMLPAALTIFFKKAL